MIPPRRSKDLSVRFSIRLDRTIVATREPPGSVGRKVESCGTLGFDAPLITTVYNDAVLERFAKSPHAVAAAISTLAFCLRAGTARGRTNRGSMDGLRYGGAAMLASVDAHYILLSEPAWSSIRDNRCVKVPVHFGLAAFIPEVLRERRVPWISKGQKVQRLVTVEIPGGEDHGPGSVERRNPSFREQRAFVRQEPIECLVVRRQGDIPFQKLLAAHKPREGLGERRGVIELNGKPRHEQ